MLLLPFLFMFRVLYFNQYLEVMTVLEEHFNGLKDIHSHKLFDPTARRSKTATRKCNIFLSNMR